MTFTGRVAMVTGGGSGLGQAAALRLAKPGVAVAVLDLNEAGMVDIAERGGAGVSTYACDVTDPDSVATVVEKIESDLGPIDRLVHAAGIMPAGRILDTSIEVLTAPMRVNYFGTVNVTKAVLPRMVERRRGDVVLFGSITGYSPSTNFSAYCASKAAVNTYGEILIHEQRNSGLRMVLVCPSAVNTPLLAQASAGGPKAFKDTVTAGRTADPEKILDKIEKALERGTTLLLPGEALPMYGLRRLSPGLMWRLVHRMNRD